MKELKDSFIIRASGGALGYSTEFRVKIYIFAIFFVD